MQARRFFPLVGLAALAAFLALRLPNAVDDALKRVRHARRDRALDADSALERVRGSEYVAAIHRIREELPPESEYLLVELIPGGADYFVRFDLAPRRAVFGGAAEDVAHNVTPAKLPTLPEWTVIARLDPPGPRLVKTHVVAERGTRP